MRALRVVLADGGGLPRLDLLALCERAGFDVVGECPEWSQVPDLVAARVPDLLLITGGPDFARGAAMLEGRLPAVVIAPDATSTKEYKDTAASAVLVPGVEPEVLSTTAQMVVVRFAELRAARDEVVKLRDQLETRKLVERAKGVLMRRLGIDEDAAYRKIQRASQDENKRMRAIAESILSAERLYDEPPAPDAPDAPDPPDEPAS